MNLLERPIRELFRTEPYYAHFLLQCSLQWVDKQTKTQAAVGMDTRTGAVMLMLEPEWFGGQTSEAQVAVLKHEVLHLALSHLARLQEARKKYSDIANLSQLSNIAQDCAINQYIENVEMVELNGKKDSGITLERLRKMLNDPELAAFETAEYYLDKIMTSAQIKTVAVSVAGFDSHALLDQNGKPLSALQKDQLAGSVLNTTKQAAGSAAGNVPHAILKQLEALLAPQICWKQTLRRFIASRFSSERQYTCRRKNRRFPLPVPGKKRKKKLKLGVCVDSSGSISDEQFTLFFSEIKAMLPLTAETVLVDADCAVQAVEVLKPTTKLKPKRTGSGGTAYQPAITECVERDCDAIIYFGDFDTSDTPQDPGKAFLWVGVRASSPPPAKFGQVVYLK